MRRLNRKFFNRNTIKVAQELLGKFIVRKIGREKIVGKIVETEAYMGPDDLASHASRGRTPRTEIMFGKPGFAYIYLIYGMYCCFNVVTEKEGFPAAVLIRSIKALGESDVNCLPRAESRGQLSKVKTDGPGKLCRYFKIDKSLNGEDLIYSKKLWIEDRGEEIKKSQIINGERIGVVYAKHCACYPWRFYIE